MNDQQARFWSDLAPTWIRLESDLEEISKLPGLIAMDRLELAPGQRVLDIGCGGGSTTLELGARVAPSGKATGVDIAPEMLAYARERAARLGAGNIDFVHADAQLDSLGESAFDAAYSRFGVMFFSDVVAAFANIRSALRPGGRLAFVCWQNALENEWMLVPTMAVMSVTGSPPPMPEPGQPGPFSLADPDRVRSVLAAAGFEGIGVAPHTDAVVTREDRIPDVARRSTQVGAAREALRDAGDDTRRRAVEAVEAALRDRVEHGEVRVSRSVWVVTAST